MSAATRDAELTAIKDPTVLDLAMRVHNDQRIPTGPLGTWAIAYARWRAGDRPNYPTPPSAARGVTTDAILRVDAIVRRLVPFRERRQAPDDVEVANFTRRRAADWNPAA